MFRRTAIMLAMTIAVAFFGAMPLITAAQSVADYENGSGSIVPPCTGASFSGTSTEHECTFCDFMQLVRNILNFIIFLTMITGGALFAWAGWLFATSGGSGPNHQKAKNVFRNVIIGLVLVLAAYTIVDTLMKMLAGGDFTSSWSTLCPQSGGELGGLGNSY